ncbi:MAG: polymer-forming cytoskeletal protein, partial [Leptospiraceae bacterium]|nr:polymer-forming cytoskeletal protein [Leptospiraceae bacterium]
MSEEKVDTIISEDIVFKGMLKFSNTLRVRGNIKGAIEANGELIVDDGGKIDADILVNSIVVNGTLNGNVEARDNVEIGKTGVLIGDIKTPQLSIETGAKFTGS